ncbi:MAG: C25 family cysteine peptidase [Acidobacteriota bacterium]
MTTCKYPRSTAVCALFVLTVGGLGATGAGAETSPTAARPAVKILLEDSGVYRVGYDDLVAIGFDDWRSPSHRLGLECDGEPVPIWVEDGGDDVFGPGDWIEFVGEQLRGDHSHLDEYTRYRAYFLHFDQESPARMMPVSAEAAEKAAQETAAEAGPWQAQRSQRHLEEDLLILRLPPAPEPEEIWFWAKLTHNQRQPFTYALDLSDLQTAGDATVSLKIHVRGWSRPRHKSSREIGDHRLEVSLNGNALTAAEWSGTKPYLLEVPAIAADHLVQGENTLALSVPRRPEGKDGHDLIDVIMLNWIEIDYPTNGWVGQDQAQFELAEPNGKPVRLMSEPDGDLRVYGNGGSRITPRVVEDTGGGEATEVAEATEAAHFLPPAGETSFWATTSDQFAQPARLAIDRPSQLADPANRADYIIISHHSLVDAIQPLAELHRQRGLDTMVVDVEDVYDEFNHGVLHPRAIRSFLRFAYEQWADPAPRFVLLVGDASWDGKNALASDANYADWTYRRGEADRFVKNTSTPYSQGSDLNQRNLIPTWNYTSHQGHSASDNYFVSVVGDDALPDMAIGRLAVVEPAEVDQIVAKIVRYVNEPEVGAWQKNLLFISNESASFQRRSDTLADQFEAEGFKPNKVYPASTETSNEHHTETLIEAFDDGQLLVHFFGHGGRYIWRTGPPDLKKNHDLFTLDHLDELQPTGRLPVILAMTCYSAPFDHPNADSIGEKFLRLADRGAIAVMAASWRISPSVAMGKALMTELTRPGATIGEALMRSKHQIRQKLFVETFNLLGDPAISMPLPNLQDASSLPPSDIAQTGEPGRVGSLEP